MNQSTLRKIQLALGFSLATSVALVAGSAVADVDDEASLDEAILAFNDQPEPQPQPLPPGARLPCSMSGTLPGARRAAELVFGEGGVCYRVPLPGNPPAVFGTPSCHSVAREYGCIIPPS